jgi:hypothetical protein
LEFVTEIRVDAQRRETAGLEVSKCCFRCETCEFEVLFGHVGYIRC